MISHIPNASDEELVLRARHGNNAAFDELVRRFRGAVIAVAEQTTGSRDCAEDVAQDAFTRAYTRFSQLRDRERFRAWLVRMTWRLAINRQRSERRRMQRETRHVDEVPPTPTTADEIAARERRQQLWRAIDALPDKLRVVTVLAGIEGHDVREVARLLRLPEGTVKSRLFLGRQRLKELLQ
jgi:RNA polymerase sigma-70 factor (ECF subfamily)